MVLALGIDGSVEGESHDRTSVALPGNQTELAKAVAAVGKPVVIVLLNGGMVEMEPLQALDAPILEAFYPGFHGGTAVAMTLYGDNEHLGGKMPFTTCKPLGVLVRARFLIRPSGAPYPNAI